MPTTYRLVCCCAVVCLLSALALAQAPAADEIVANQNRIPAGKLEHGVLNVQLELRSGAWRPEAEDGPQLFVQAFGEAGRAAQIPGPMLRMPEGTTVHATVTNKLKMKATVYGLNTRPGDATTGVEIPAGESREFTFAAGAPGTYYYWARTTEPLKVGPLTIVRPVQADTHLNGAFIVDPAGPVPPDRVFVINAMVALADVVHPTFEVLTINGKSYPYTEPLEYTAGDTIRWRVINPSFAEHPMHLHGAFYQVLSLGNSQTDTAYAGADRQSVVTQNLRPGTTMMLEWTPEHVGRWLYHCHFQSHFSTEKRVPVFSRAMAAPPGESEAANGAHAHHEAMGAMNDMAGLVLVINVKAPSSAPVRASVGAPRKIDLVIEPNAAGGKSPTFSCSVREGKKIVASEDKSVGPPIIVTRGEPTEITVVNHLDAPTTIHWHGLELDSYYDGVVGGGAGDQVTPAIQPGASFVARFTPTRAGTFIYHTHAADPNQLSGGVYGGLIVLEPGESFDAEHDRLLVIGARDDSFFTTRITVNGLEELSPMMFSRGVKYRLRVINMAPDLAAEVQLGGKEHPATWRPIAKDGANVPSRLAKPEDAVLHVASGEVYDFEFQPDTPGEIPWQVENYFNNKSKLVGKIVVQ
ncbi:MAG: multicopper oxidase domain-containing protein [Terriglobales bacterium]